jgi:uncharacterized protein
MGLDPRRAKGGRPRRTISTLRTSDRAQRRRQAHFRLLASRPAAARLALVSLLALASLPAAGGAAAAAAFSPPPPPRSWVTDTAGFLSPQARAALDARLAAYQRETGHQVLVWIGRSAGNVPIEEFAVRAFQAWRVGRKGIDDGLVIFIFAGERKIRFEVGYGLEDKVPDVVASRIAREVMGPRLRAGDRDGALSAGVEATLAAISGPSPETPAGGASGSRPGSEQPAAPGVARPGMRGVSVGKLIVVGILALAFLFLLITHPSLALYLLFNLLSGGRGGGGGGGGDGGFSGGGGRSGGGGSTDSW